MTNMPRTADDNDRINKARLRRFTIFFYVSAAIALLNGLYIFTVAMTYATRYPQPLWLQYGTIVLGSLLVPASFGVLVSLFSRQRFKRDPETRHRFFWTAAMLGLVVVPAHYYVSMGISRIGCGQNCVHGLSDMGWLGLGGLSLVLAVATPLILAYYRWPKLPTQK